MKSVAKIAPFQWRANLIAVVVWMVLAAVLSTQIVSAAGSYHTPSSTSQSEISSFSEKASDEAETGEDSDETAGVSSEDAAIASDESTTTSGSWWPVVISFAVLAGAYYFFLYRNGQSLTEYIEKRYKKD